MNVQKFIAEYEKDISPLERYASFDYCYNYFQTFYENNEVDRIASKENMQSSCIQLGFYLASWGMYRGSSFLLKKSAKCFEPVIQKISTFNNNIWEIDVDKYSAAKI